MSQNTELLIFFVVLAIIFVIALLTVITGVVRYSKMGRSVTHDTYGTNPYQQRQDGMNSPTGTGTNKFGNVPDSNRP